MARTKEQRADYNKKYYLENKVRENERTEKYRKANPEISRAIQKRSYQKNKTKRIAEAKKYHAANPEQVAATLKRYMSKISLKRLEWAKDAREKLTDAYVRERIHYLTGLTADQINICPEMIEDYRLLLITKRKLKSLNNENESTTS